MKREPPIVSTFSIVAFDPDQREWGIAVESKFLAVGVVVPWAKAGVGAIATQSFANTSYGPRGLELLAQGLSAQETLDRLVADDPEREHRQVGVVDAAGRSATFTGRDCHAWAGGITGEHFAAQGNILVSEETVKAMAATFQATDGTMARRLVAALDAGQEAGGDSRGRQSAALLVVKEKGGYGGFNDRYIDLRVDDHPEPIKELARILGLQELYFSRPKPNELVPLDEAVTSEVQEILREVGYHHGRVDGVYDQATKDALFAYMGTENLEERRRDDVTIDRTVLEYMRAHRKR